jgi:hypothetical protein
VQKWIRNGKGKKATNREDTTPRRPQIIQQEDLLVRCREFIVLRGDVPRADDDEQEVHRGKEVRPCVDALVVEIEKRVEARGEAVELVAVAASDEGVALHPGGESFEVVG